MVVHCALLIWSKYKFNAIKNRISTIKPPNMIRILLLSFNCFVCHLHFDCASMSVFVLTVYSLNYDCFVEALCAVIYIQFFSMRAINMKCWIVHTTPNESNNSTIIHTYGSFASYRSIENKYSIEFCFFRPFSGEFRDRNWIQFNSIDTL